MDGLWWPIVPDYLAWSNMTHIPSPITWYSLHIPTTYIPSTSAKVVIPKYPTASLSMPTIGPKFNVIFKGVIIIIRMGASQNIGPKSSSKSLLYANNCWFSGSPNLRNTYMVVSQNRGHPRSSTINQLVINHPFVRFLQFDKRPYFGGSKTYLFEGPSGRPNPVTRCGSVPLSHTTLIRSSDPKTISAAPVILCQEFRARIGFNQDDASMMIW